MKALRIHSIGRFREPVSKSFSLVVGRVLLNLLMLAEKLFRSLASKLFNVMARSRAVSLFNHYTHPALLAYTKQIHDALNGNALFPTPPVTLADQLTANN